MLRGRSTAHGKGAVVTGLVTHVGLDQIKVGLITGAYQPVGKVMRVRAAALARDGIDRLHAIRTHFVEALGRQRHDFAFAHAGFQRFEYILIHAIAHGRGHVEQRDFIVAFDLARVQHHLLAINHVEAQLLQRKQKQRLAHINAQRHVGHALGLEHVVNFLGGFLEQTHPGVDRTTQAHIAREAMIGRQPRRVNLVMARGGTKIPHPRFAITGQQTPAR